MADSNITKKALASAMKDLMKTTSFSKINISDICDKCDMNRKSFYYHFKDKYDLVNWIFDTEFINVINEKGGLDRWDFLSALCTYVYENRDFYYKALQIRGQNSFLEHFHEMLSPIVAEHLRKIITRSELTDFHINFITDGFVCTIERWIIGKNQMTPEELISQIKFCIEQLAEDIWKKKDKDNIE